MKSANPFHESRANRAFSLVELMIVIALMAIIASIAVPSFQGYIRRTNFRTAVHEITSDLFFAKERALSENRYYRVSFSVGASSYTLDQGASTGGPYATLQTKNLTNLARETTIAAASYGGNAYIICQPRGTCTAGSVQVTNTASTATVTTTNTGRTYVQYAGE